MKRFIYLIFIVMLVFLGACSRNRVMKGMTVEEKMNRGNSYFERGKYNAAKEFYESIIYDRTSVYTSTAQMRLADCYYHTKKYSEALFEYEELIRLFPDYEDVARAYYMIGICYWETSLPAHYTQEETLNAQAAFELFVEKFPFDERRDKALEYIEKCNYRLLEKKYWNGYSYYKIYDYSAAELYFNEVLAADLNAEIDRKALYYLARIYLYRENLPKAEQIFAKLQEKYSQSKETENIQKRLQK